MSDERTESTEDQAPRERDDEGSAATSAVQEAPLAPAPQGPPAAERVDEDGLPLDRPATLDDVRSDAGSGRVIAVGCSVLVAVVLALFWLIRGGLLR